MTLRHLLRYIDGVSHVKKIASAKRDSAGDVTGNINSRDDIGMDIECVKRALRVLSFYKCVIISDILQFSNVYQLSTNARWLLRDEGVLKEMRDFCSISGKTVMSTKAIAKLLLLCQPGRDLKCILKKSLELELELDLDLRRLLAIAQEKGVLHRKHEFPFECDKVYIAPRKVDGPNDAAGELSKSQQPQPRLHDHNESLDHICCEYNVSRSHILANPKVYLVYK